MTLRAVLLIGMILSHGGIAALAQSPKPAPSSARPAVKATEPGEAEAASLKELKELKEKLAAAQAELTQLVGPNPETTGSSAETLGITVNEEALETREQLSLIVRSYVRRIASLESMGSELQRSADLDREEAAWKWVALDGRSSEAEGRLPFPNPPPYSIRMVDELRESLQSVQQYAQTVAFTLALVNNGIADIQNNAEQLEVKLRQLNEKIEKAKEPAATAQLGAQRDRLQLALRAGNVKKEMLQGELKLWSAKESNLKRQSELLRRQIAAASARMRFTQADLDKINAAGATQARKLDKELQKLIAEAQPIQGALSEARQNFIAAQQTVPGPENPSAELSAKLAQLKELVEVRRIQAETNGFRQEQLNQLQQLGTMELAAWQHRFHAQDLDKASEARQKFAAFLERLRILQSYYQEQSTLNSRQLSDLEDYARTSTTAPPASLKIARDKLDSLRLRDESYKRMLQALEKLGRQIQRWQEEIGEDQAAAADPKRLMAGWYAGLGVTLSNSWNYEFYKAIDPSFPGGLRPITVGKVLTALCILLVGYFICQLLSREMQRFLTRRVRVETNMANIIRGWMMFSLTVILVMIAMDWVKIPLTAFAFLGGALAIGVGFGTQNLLKNFISGIMLLVEQPLRLGDLVEVGSSRGKVVSIGIRSSVIRNSDGIETLIPNSAFLESNVTNWTYSNPQVRFRIRVGVAFTTSSREVADLLTSVVEAHGQVNATPKPQVLLEEFTDKGMAFSLYYWLEPLQCDPSAISSDLRFMIEHKLSEAGIQMA